jgi:PTS system nitrogen regulatory IIA component
MDRILTIEEAAKYLKISVSSLYKLARENKIPAFKILNKWRFDRSEIDRMIKKRSFNS